jgi:carbon storage regulator
MRGKENMLVLMRKPGESIHVGPNIVITLVALERNRARIGIEAPRDVPIDREEIAEKKAREQTGGAAAQGQDDKSATGS